MAFAFFLRNAPKSMDFIFGDFFIPQNQSRAFPPNNPLPTVRNLRNAPFSYLENWQMDISRFLKVEKLGILREIHVINLKMGKESKMIVLDFLAFQRKMQMPSKDKILIHMLLEAFRGTTRMNFRCNNVHQP